MLGKSPLNIGVAAFLFAVVSTQAEIVWSDDFETGAGAFPTRDFTSNSRDDYQGATINNSSFFRVNDGALTINDPISAAQGAGGVLAVSMDDFAPFSTAPASGTPILNVSFDLRVDSYLSTGSNLAFRFILRANGSQAAGNQMVIAFNRGALDDGDADTDLALSVGTPDGTSHMSASATTAVGFIPGVGWLPGFDFGNYNPDNAADNNTGDAFYNVSFSYDSISGGVNGVVTRIASDATNGFSAPFTLQMNSGLDFSNTDSTDLFILASADSLEGVAHFDNIVFEAVPEPSVASGLLLGVAALGARRRRKSA